MNKKIIIEHERLFVSRATCDSCDEDFDGFVGAVLAFDGGLDSLSFD